MAYATVAGVEARMDRPLTPEEQTVTETLLNDVEAVIRTRVPDLDVWVATRTGYLDLVVMVEANAAMRVIRNPGGFRQESEGNYQYSLDVRAASGFLSLMDYEWGWLGVSGIGMIKPGDQGDDDRCFPRDILRYPRRQNVQYIPLPPGPIFDWPCGCDD